MSTNATTPATTFVIPTATSLREEREEFITSKAKELADGVLKKVEEILTKPKEELFCKLHKGEVKLYKANQNSTLLREAIIPDSAAITGLTGKIVEEILNKTLSIVKSVLKEYDWTIDVQRESYEFSGPVAWVILREI